MSKLKTIPLTSTASEVTDGEVVLTLKSDDKDYDKQETAYTKAAAYREGLVGSIATTVATEAKALFEDETVDLVTGSLDFGPTTLSATVYRNYVAGEGEDSIPNHVVVASVDDFTNTVTTAVAGIFDDSSEEDAA